MHSKEMGVEFYMFHNKPYDFNCVVTLTLYIYIYIYTYEGKSESKVPYFIAIK